MRRLLVGLAVLVGSCGDADEARTTGWVPLVDAAWTVPAASESYICVRTELSRAMALDGFRAPANAGIHHALLTIDEDGAPLGVAPCSASSTGARALFATGIGETSFSLPLGAGVVLEGGTRLLLNLHVINASPRLLTGRTLIEAHPIDPKAIRERVELLLAGKTNGLSVPPGTSTQVGVCTLSVATTLFAVLPHMHARGRNLAVRVEGGATLFDAQFDEDRAAFSPFTPPTQLAAGARMRVECSYENTGRNTLVFGPSEADEMCYAIFYRSPVGSPAVCTE